MGKSLFMVGLLVTILTVGALAESAAVAKNEAVSGAEVEKLWIENVQGSTGDTVVVKLMIDNPATDVDAVTLDVTFDPKMLAFAEHKLGEMDPKWQMESAREVSPGVVRFVAFAVNSNIPKGSSGSMVELVFNVTCDTCNAKATSSLKIENIHDDIANFSLTEGTFTYLAK